jgi:molybdopterin synthase catalytic subunit
MFKVTTEPLNVQTLNDLVKRPTDGAVVTFDGIVRNSFDGLAVRSLEYEAYAEMAEKKMAQIGEEVRQKFPIGKIAIIHRLGQLDIGESSIIIAVAAPHRHEAFEACAYAMDRVKEEVPIWKKEFFTDGNDHWVNQN